MKVETVSIPRPHSVAPARGGSAVRFGDLLELSKPRITLMVLVTVAAGAYLAAPAELAALAAAELLVATGLLAASASALNQAIEAGEDARMRRTAARPVASGRVDRGLVMAGAAASSVVALLLLFFRANPLAAAVGAATLVSYLFLYTPAKKRTAWSTLIGAVPGALPPVIGWAAASGEIGPGAWVLFGIVFLWQLPHFMAIAWMYRDDYERGGFVVLPLDDATGTRTAVAMMVPTLLLLALTTAAPALGLGSSATVAGGLVAGLGFTVACVRFWRSREVAAARTVLLASVAYLPAVLAVVLIDHLPAV